MLSKLEAFQCNAFLQFGTISKIFNIEKGWVTFVRASVSSKGSSAQDMHVQWVLVDLQIAIMKDT